MTSKSIVASFLTISRARTSRMEARSSMSSIRSLTMFPSVSSRLFPDWSWYSRSMSRERENSAQVLSSTRSFFALVYCSLS